VKKEARDERNKGDKPNTAQGTPIAEEVRTSVEL